MTGQPAAAETAPGLYGGAEEHNGMRKPELPDSTDSERRSDPQRHENRVFTVNAVISMITLCVTAAGFALGFAYLNDLKHDLGISKSRLVQLENDISGPEGGGTDTQPAPGEQYIDAVSLIDVEEKNEPAVPMTDDSGDVGIERGKILIYDSYVGYGWVPVLSGVKTNPYRSENFSIDENDRMRYVADGKLSSYFGIDVSSFQGDIDWDAARADGVEFAILRIGVRGYGEEGNIKLDEKFYQNYDNAHRAGIDLGVYFYSQAITVDEAVEEAHFVLENLDGRTLEYPVVFDWEPVTTSGDVTPRTEDMMPGTLNLCASAFMEAVRDAGYEAMLYTNKKMAYLKYDMRRFQDYPVWLAQYSGEVTYYYDFDMWQYGFGRVDGIEGDVDLDIAMIK